MSTDTLPTEVEDAVDRWVESSDEGDLDALERALTDAAELDGDLEGRATALRSQLPVEGRAGPSRRWGLVALAAAALLVLGVFGARDHTLLVRPDEAAAPLLEGPPRGAMSTAGAGPSITLVSPSVDEPLGPDPFRLAIEVAPGPSGVEVDLASLQVVYLRGSGIDLLPRLGGSWTGSSFEARGLRLPPGRHPLRVVVADTDAEATVLSLVLEVTP